MGERAGVLLDTRVLGKAMRRRPVTERVDLYAAAAKELGCEVVLFSIHSIDFKRKAVRGYVPNENGTFRRDWIPLPKVIHNRALLNRNPTGLRVLRKLRTLGVHVFNPIINHDKYHIHRLLFQNEELRRYLPDTIPFYKSSFKWFRSRLVQHGEVFIKPRRGSLGIGIARVRRVRQGLYRYESGRTVAYGSLARMWRLARRRRRTGYLLQVGIPLAQVDGHRFDLRVPVQKDATGRWRVPGMAAKRTGSHPYLTNIAMGGTALKIHDAIKLGLSGVNADHVIQEIERLALGVAETLNRRYPKLADIGLDVGLDQQGNPFLIEVNRRDLRIILSRAGEDEVYAELYRNPLAYAGYLMQTGS